MKIFRNGDTVKLSSVLLSYPQNKKWIGIEGTVTEVDIGGVYVQWPQCKVPTYIPIDHIDKVEPKYSFYTPTRF